MNKKLIANINQCAKEDDTIYFLGDFCFGGHRLTPVWRDALICKNIHLCRGNHDGHIDDYRSSFSSINDVMTVKHEDKTFFLSHYKHAIWYGSHKGVIHLYGHSHGSVERWVIGKSMDVGVDNAYKLVGEYRPFSLPEVVKMMNKRQIYTGDHQTENTDI